MILGFGIDMVDIRRIEKALEKHGERFKTRSFTKAERAYAKNDAAKYAKRFAAKEAAAKALGIGHQEDVYLKNIEVVKNKLGKPDLVFSAGAKKALAAMTPKGMKSAVFLSLTDEYPYAQAQVIISAVPV